MLTKRRASEDFWSERLETQSFPCADWHVYKATEETTVKLTHKKKLGPLHVTWFHVHHVILTNISWCHSFFSLFFLSKNFSFSFQKDKIKKNPYLNFIIFIIVGLIVSYFLFLFFYSFCLDLIMFQVVDFELDIFQVSIFGWVWTLSCFLFIEFWKFKGWIKCYLCS